MIAEAQEQCSSLDTQRTDLAAKMDRSKDILEIIKVATDILKLQKQQNQILQEALRKRQELDDDRSLHECYFMFAIIALMAWVLVVAWVRQLSAWRRKRRPRFFVRERPDIVRDGEERAEL